MITQSTHESPKPHKSQLILLTALQTIHLFLEALPSFPGPPSNWFLKQMWVNGWQVPCPERAFDRVAVLRPVFHSTITWDIFNTY